MPSLRTVELVGSVTQQHVTLVCDPTGPHWLRQAEHYGVGSWDIAGRKIGQIAGERIEGVTAAPRLVSVPVLVKATSEQEVDDYLGQYGRLLNPQSGPCRIIHRRPDGTGREIIAYYVAGGERVEVEHNQTRFVRVPLVFRAMDPPFWRSTTDTDELIADVFNDAYASGVNEVEIDNVGDVAVYPWFRFTPPVQNIEVCNLNTGQVFRINERILAGQVDIDTDPRGFQVLLDNQPAFDSIVDAGVSEFFWLEPGLNRVLLRAAGQSAATVGAVGGYQMGWRPLFDTP